MDMLNAKEMVGLIGGSVTVLVAAWKIKKDTRVWLATKRSITSTRNAVLSDLSEAIKRIEPALLDVQTQLRVNGGSTLRDAVNELRNEYAVERAARRVVSNVASLEMGINPLSGDMSVLFVSAAFSRLSGLSRDDCEHDGWLRAVEDEQRERVTRVARESMESQSVMSVRYVVQHVYTRGRTRVEHTGTPVLNMRGAFVGFVVVITPLEEDVAA